MSAVRVEETDDAFVISFSDSRIADETRIMDIGDELQEIARTIPDGRKMVLDFQGVEYCSSAMVGQLVQLQKATKQHSVDLRLHHVAAVIHEILQIMHLDKVFRIENPAD